MIVMRIRARSRALIAGRHADKPAIGRLSVREVYRAIRAVGIGDPYMVHVDALAGAAN